MTNTKPLLLLLFLPLLFPPPPPPTFLLYNEAGGGGGGVASEAPCVRPELASPQAVWRRRSARTRSHTSPAAAASTNQSTGHARPTLHAGTRRHASTYVLPPSLFLACSLSLFLSFARACALSLLPNDLHTQLHTCRALSALASFQR